MPTLVSWLKPCATAILISLNRETVCTVKSHCGCCRLSIVSDEKLRDYKCEGKTGKLSVLVQSNKKASFETLATGQGVRFKGNVK